MILMLIGIVGLQGSGKSTLSKMIMKEVKNVAYLDIDNISHSVLELDKCKKEIIDTFGDVVTDDKIDRIKLGNIVFKSKEKMDKLTLCTWKYMEELIDEFIKKNSDKTIILDWILLQNCKFLNMCDIKILLDTPYEIRKERVLKRDGISSERFDFRDKAALEYDRCVFDFIIKEVNEDVVKEIIERL